MNKLQLAMLAGARAIETTKRFYGTTFVHDAFGDAEELPYYEAAEILREYSELDLAEVIRCENCTHSEEHFEASMFHRDGGGIERYCYIDERHPFEVEDDNFCCFANKKENKDNNV